MILSNKFCMQKQELGSILLDYDSGKYLQLNDTGAACIDIIVGFGGREFTVIDVAKRFGNQFNIEESIAENHVSHFVGQLRDWT